MIKDILACSLKRLKCGRLIVLQAESVAPLIETRHEKICLRGFGPAVRYKPDCNTTEDGKRVINSDFGSLRITNGADQLRLCLCFRI